MAHHAGYRPHASEELPNSSSRPASSSRDSREHLRDDAVRVFLASPSDLRKEREAFPALIRELSGSPDCSGRGVEALIWEQVIAPYGVAPQSIINELIDRCDVFVIAYGTRWGRRAKHSEYSSYTEEEFFRAYDRFLDCNCPRIITLFKRVHWWKRITRPGDWRRIAEFRAQIEEAQYLFYEYGSIDDFRTVVRRVVAASVHTRVAAAGSRPTELVVPTGLQGRISSLEAELEEARETLASAQLADGTSPNRAQVKPTRRGCLATAGPFLSTGIYATAVAGLVSISDIELGATLWIPAYILILAYRVISGLPERSESEA